MSKTSHRSLHLGYVYNVNGEHWAAWRDDAAQQDAVTDIAYIERAARSAESAKFDFFFLGDGIPGDIRRDQWFTTHNTLRLEPFTLLSRLAAVTSQIGLVGTAHTTFYEPFVLSRLTASLDWISHGRFGLNAVLGDSDQAARNYSLRDLGGSDRYARGAEFLDVLRQLWDSTETQAYAQDKASGQYLNSDYVHPLEWTGEYFSVEGALPLIAPPQGQIPVLYAGASEASRQLSASYADVNFTRHQTAEESREFNIDVRNRAEVLGRDPERILFLPGVVPILGDTRRAAIDKLEHLNRLIPLADEVVLGGRPLQYWQDEKGHPRLPDEHISDPVQDRNLAYLSATIGIDLTGFAIDEQLPVEALQGVNERGAYFVREVERLTDRTLTPSKKDRHLRPRDLLWQSLYGKFIRFGSFPILVGTASDVADVFEQWFITGAADGFNIFVPAFWEQSDRITDTLVPELQRRGLFRRDYESNTLSGHFGIDPAALQSRIRKARA